MSKFYPGTILLSSSRHKRFAGVKSEKGGAKNAVIEFNGGKFAFGNIDLLATVKSTRVKALRRMFSESALPEKEQAAWPNLIKKESLSDASFAELMDTLSKTPERFAASLTKPQTLGPCGMVPTDLTYYERLVGPIPNEDDFGGYLAGSLAAVQKELAGTGTRGLRKLAFAPRQSRSSRHPF
jgi:hypothetical protein